MLLQLLQIAAEQREHAGARADERHVGLAVLQVLEVQQRAVFETQQEGLAGVGELHVHLEVLFVHGLLV